MMHSWLAQQRPWLQRARRSAYFTVRSERVRQESHEDILDAVHGFTQLGLGHSIGSLVWWNGQDLSDLSWNGSRDQGPRRVPSHRSRCSQVPWTMCKVFWTFAASVSVMRETNAVVSAWKVLQVCFSIHFSFSNWKYVSNYLTPFRCHSSTRWWIKNTASGL